jgi:hypothetical protein
MIIGCEKSLFAGPAVIASMDAPIETLEEM